jgi:hypothetical protein
VPDVCTRQQLMMSMKAHFSLPLIGIAAAAAAADTSLLLLLACAIISRLTEMILSSVVLLDIHSSFIIVIVILVDVRRALQTPPLFIPRRLIDYCNALRSHALPPPPHAADAVPS